jgi:cytochrome P450
VNSVLYAEIRERRRSRPTGSNLDLLAILMQAVHDDGRPLSDVELRDEAITIILGGLDTTATAMSWVVERLARHPSCAEQLSEEVRAGSITLVDAVIKETLRLRPVFSVVARRLQTPLAVGDTILPAGTTVTPSIYLTHRRPDLYPEPHLFRPERFLDQQPSPYTWIPFGGGVRRCIGAAFAEIEMRIVISALFEAYEIRAEDIAPEPARRRGITHAPKRETAVVLTKRDRPSIPRIR